MRGSVVVVEQRCPNSLPPRAAAPPHPSRSRHLRGAVVAVLAAVTPVLFTRLARPWRRNSRCVDVLRRAKAREDAMDARGATVLYARTRAKLRRRAAWEGAARGSRGRKPLRLWRNDEAEPLQAKRCVPRMG